MDEGEGASGALATAGDREALEEELRLRARLWARGARRLCLAVLLAALAACAGATALVMNLR